MENGLFAACFSFYGAESGRHPPVLLQQRLNLKIQASFLVMAFSLPPVFYSTKLLQNRENGKAAPERSKIAG